jgi:peroxiredoxin
MKWRGVSEKTAIPASTYVPLGQKLLEIKAGIAQYVRPDNQSINERAIRELTDSGIAEKILPIGANAPEFRLLDQNGNQVSSAELLSKGPLVISFFRGRWCPFCVAEIESLRDVLPHIENAGASLIAISPMQVRHNFFMADQHRLHFPVLSDSGNQVARKFGLAYRVPDYQKQLYRSVFVNLPHLNGDDSWELPLPATYVIGRDGNVLFAYASANYMERAEPADVLAALKDPNNS